jgi:hypothetical protein
VPQAGSAVTAEHEQVGVAGPQRQHVNRVAREDVPRHGSGRYLAEHLVDDGPLLAAGELPGRLATVFVVGGDGFHDGAQPLGLSPRPRQGTPAGG